ncbi:MAG: hypothetical protein GF313_13325 [Caldithrix sp.]|nr:hypothetical protein [Caldithrix sp.]
MNQIVDKAFLKVRAMEWSLALNYLFSVPQNDDLKLAYERCIGKFYRLR